MLQRFFHENPTNHGNENPYVQNTVTNNTKRATDEYHGKKKLQDNACNCEGKCKLVKNILKCNEFKVFPNKFTNGACGK